jgi:hypothetical protein
MHLAVLSKCELQKKSDVLGKENLHVYYYCNMREDRSDLNAYFDLIDNLFKFLSIKNVYSIFIQ